MSYWYYFSDNFQISPPASSEAIAHINEWDGYWLISDDGSEVEQADVGGNNCNFVTDLNEIAEKLAEYGSTLNGKSYYQGEEPIAGECGVVTISDGSVEEIEFGEILEVLRKHD